MNRCLEKEGVGQKPTLLACFLILAFQQKEQLLRDDFPKAGSQHSLPSVSILVTLSIRSRKCQGEMKHITFSLESEGK